MENRLDTGRIYRSEKTAEGFLRVWMSVSKVGDLVYRTDNGDRQVETVTAETLFDEESLHTAWGKPITAVFHPKEMLDSTTTAPVQVGMTMTKFDEAAIGDGYLTMLGVFTDQRAIDLVEGGMTQISAGYTADVVDGADGKKIQTNRRYNHFTVLPYGRAGETVKVHLDCLRCDAVSEKDFETIGEPATQPAAIATEKKQSKQRRDEGGYMAQIKLDGADWELETPVIQAIRADQKSTAAEIKQLQTKLDAKEDESCQLKAKLDAAETQVQTLTGEVQGLKTKLDELTTSDEAIAAEVQARNDEWGKVLPSIKAVDPDYRMDASLPVSGIRREYLVKVRKQDAATLEKASDELVHGMFMALQPDAKQDAADKTRSHLDQLDDVERRDGRGGITSLEEARKKAAQRKEKAYMGGDK